jgi:hypothetical protein
MLDDPDPFSSLESLKQYLAELATMPDYMFNQQDVDMRQRIIGIRSRGEAFQWEVGGDLEQPRNPFSAPGPGDSAADVSLSSRLGRATASGRRSSRPLRVHCETTWQWRRPRE